MAQRADMRLNPSFLPPSAMTEEQRANFSPSNYPTFLSQVRDFQRPDVTWGYGGSTFSTSPEFSTSAALAAPGLRGNISDFRGWIWDNPNQAMAIRQRGSERTEGRAARPGGGVSRRVGTSGSTPAARKITAVFARGRR